MPIYHYLVKGSSRTLCGRDWHIGIFTTVSERQVTCKRCLRSISLIERADDEMMDNDAPHAGSKWRRGAC